MSKLLKKNGVVVEEALWPRVIAFAEREGLVDYKFLLEVFKD